ncbi:MAG: hypothetical protein JJU29_11930 [Verrucomicrobia bacterium]|nr:hypothetical protein [Verrucomicrobiota bacterium]
MRAPSAIFLIWMAWACAWVQARPVRVTLWISGGTSGILTAGREAPGILGLLRHQRETDDRGFWLDVGGSPTYAALANNGHPDVLVPNAESLRLGGLPLLVEPEMPWTFLNTGILPQYPGETVPGERAITLNHSDGPRIQVHALLDAELPLQVPPQQLRPLHIQDPREALRARLPEIRGESGVFQVLVLPEHARGGDWSREFPDFPLVIEHAGPIAEVYSLDDGARLRVRPGRFGRTLVRVDLTWDTVTQSFGPPVGEVVWVSAAGADGLEVPDELRARLRPLHQAPDPENWRSDRDFESAFSQAVLARADAELVLIPRLRRNEIVYPEMPEFWRVAWVEEDDVWVKVRVPAPIARSWRDVELAGASWWGRIPGGEGDVTVVMPGRVAAGSGGETWHLREVLDDPEIETEILEMTLRDLLPLSLEESQ